VASISGHRDPRILFRYSHPIRQEVIDRSEAAGSRQKGEGHSGWRRRHC
jgi:hypothetical protein